MSFKNTKIQCEEEGPEYEDYDTEDGSNTTNVDILTNPDGEPCIYLCSDDGGCSVRYAGPPQSGSTVGKLKKNNLLLSQTFRELFFLFIWRQL